MEMMEIPLSNGKVIDIYYIANVQGGKVRHRDGRITVLKIAGISTEYYYEDIHSLEPERFIAFETGENCEVDKEIITKMIAKYLQENDSEICQYIGEYSEESGQFDRKNRAVEAYVKNNIKNGIEEEENQKQKARKERLKAQNRRQADLEAKMREEAIRSGEREKNRKREPFIRKLGKDVIDEKTYYDYNGTSMLNEGILEIRNLNKVGKDKNGTYLYAGYINLVNRESKPERISGEPEGRYVCFETKKKIEDIVKTQNPKEVQAILSLLSLPEPSNYTENGTLNYIGAIDEYGQVTRGDRARSAVIRRKIEEMREAYVRKRNEENQEMEYGD